MKDAIIGSTNLPSQCGQIFDETPRILNGREVKYGELPWQVMHKICVIYKTFDLFIHLDQ